MLFHVSIDAQDPQNVANILAKFMGGKATPFPPVRAGSWVAHSGDEHNTLIEVYPAGTQLVPAQDGVIGIDGQWADRSSEHFALGTCLSEEQVFEISRQQGWPAETFDRDGRFRVIEVWMEGTRLLELLTQEMQREYLESVRLDRWEQELADAGLLEMA